LYNWRNCFGLLQTNSNRNNGLCSYYLRGGPAFTLPSAWYYFVDVETDERKKLQLEFEFFYNTFDEHASYQRQYEVDIRYRPVNALQIRFNPEYSFEQNRLQYIDTHEGNGTNRYIFGSITRKTLALTIRMDLNITPELTVQYYGQPFIGSGNYSSYKYITNPTADAFSDRYQIIESENITYDSNGENYTVNEDNMSYSFDDPDFNFKEFRSNFVARWEYRPGSIIYAVWTQARSDRTTIGSFRLKTDFNDLYSIFPHNIFLIKLTHRFAI
jgi:hypothetical protein